MLNKPPVDKCDRDPRNAKAFPRPLCPPCAKYVGKAAASTSGRRSRCGVMIRGSNDGR